MKDKPSEALETLLTTAEVAELLRVKPSTVRTWRQRGYGPGPWIPAGRKRLIRAQRVTAWMAAEEQAADVYAA